MSKKKKQIQDQWSAIPPPSSHKIPRQRQKSLHCKPTLQQAIDKAASIQTPPLHCKLQPQKVSPVQDSENKDIDTPKDIQKNIQDQLSNLYTFTTSIPIEDLGRTHFIDPLTHSISTLNKITSPSIFFNVAIIPVNVFQPHRQSCYIITSPPNQYHVHRTRIEFTQKNLDYFYSINTYNVEHKSLLEPHIISKAFPIFSSMYTLLENSSVSSLIDNIEKNISSTLTTPLVAGVEINMLSEIQALEVTMYISMRFTEYDKIKTSFTLSQIDSKNTLTPLELFILIAHERMQCPIIFTNYEQDSANRQFRVIDILDSRKIKEEIAFVNKKIKYRY